MKCTCRLENVKRKSGSVKRFGFEVGGKKSSIHNQLFSNALSGFEPDLLAHLQ